MVIKVRVLYFGQARDAAGTSDEELSLSAPASIEDLLEKMEARHAALAKLKKSTRIAVNTEMAKQYQNLDDGDEVAFLPPVAGG